MAREPFETLPVWRAATRLAVDAHRFTADFPADEKSGLGGTLKRLADQPAQLLAHAHAADTPEETLTHLHKAEPVFRELLNAAVLAHHLAILHRAQLRKLRRHAARLRRLIQREIEALQPPQAEARVASERQTKPEAEAATHDPASHEPTAAEPEPAPPLAFPQAKQVKPANAHGDDHIELHPIRVAGHDSAPAAILLRLTPDPTGPRPGLLRRLFQNHRAA